MLTPDLCSRTYTAEVLRTSGEDSANSVADLIARLTREHHPEERVASPGGAATKMRHSFVASSRRYHRTTTTLQARGQRGVNVPRTVTIRGKQHYLYDVLLAQHRGDVMVAVPYHALAEVFFVQVDRALAGKGARYEKLDIRKLVIRLGKTGITEVLTGESPRKLEVGITRCQLAYSDPEGRSRSLQQVSMSGAQIGATDVYAFLTEPVLDPSTCSLDVTPVLLGFALFADDVRKTSATTDRHGNFKLWVGPGATRIERLFALLEGIKSMEGIISTTSNIPILQSDAIRGTTEA